MELRVEMRPLGKGRHTLPWMTDENDMEWTPADQDGPQATRKYPNGVMLIACECTDGAEDYTLIGFWDGEQITIKGRRQIKAYINSHTVKRDTRHLRAVE